MRRTVAALALVLTLAGCGSDSPDTTPTTRPAAAPTGTPTPTETAEPQTIEAAKAVAQRASNLHVAGDYAGSWELYSAAGQRAVSKADFIRYNTTCMPDTLPEAHVDSARQESTTKVVVIMRQEQTNATQAYTVVYEDGHWRMNPSRPASKNWAKGVDKAIADDRENGTCAG